MSATDDLEYDKEVVLNILKENRSKHQAIFDEACEGYRTEAIRQLEEHLERVRKGNRVRVLIQLPVPENFTKDYDRVIRMLELTLGDKITLSQEEFRMFIMDDWSWKRAFITSNSTYIAGSSLEDTF